MVEASPRTVAIVMLVAGVVLLLFGLMLLYSGWEIWHPYWASASWHVAPATVLSAELDERWSSGGSDSVPSATWSVVCSCRLEVDGAAIPCTRVTPTAYSSSLRESHERRFQALERHREDGTPILVWVNPADPSDCFVFRELSPFWYYFAAFGAPLMFLGCCLVVVGAVRLVRGAVERVRRRWGRGW